jgi:hypothetical protein
MDLHNSIILLVYLPNAVVLIVASILALQRKRIYGVLWGALLIFHMLSIAQSKSLLAEFGSGTLLLGQALMLLSNSLLFATCFLFESYLLTSDVRFRGVRSWLTSPDPTKNRYLTMIVIVSIAVIGMQVRDGIERLTIGWEDARESASMLDSVAIFLSFIVFPSVWVAIRSKLYFPALLLGLIYLGIFQIIGSRAILLTLLAAAYAELLLSKVSLRRKMVIIVLLGIVGTGMHTASRLTRGHGLFGMIDIVTSGDATVVIDMLTDFDLSGGEANIYRYYNYVIDTSYDEYPYRAWVTVKRLILLYCPTSWAPDIKPMDITYRLYSDAFADGIFNESAFFERLRITIEGEQAGSIHPTLWGDMYANGGLAGVVIYPVCLGFILVLIERYIRKLSPAGIFLIVPLTIVGYIMVARGNVVIGFGYLGYTIPMVIVLASISRLRLFNKKSRRSLAA